jgi:hypothetical protein
MLSKKKLPQFLIDTKYPLLIFCNGAWTTTTENNSLMIIPLSYSDYSDFEYSSNLSKLEKFTHAT